jgi:predicted Zn finger-like uncharacterized protein
MSVPATCPECSASASVPDEAVGKKVRCKKCQATFRVEPPSSGKKRPGSKSNLIKTESKNGRGDTPSGGFRRPKKSNATLWVVLAVVTVFVGGGIGAAVWLAMQDEPVKVAKGKSRKTDETSSKSKADDTKPSKGKEFKSEETPIAKAEPKRPGSKTATKMTEQSVEPTVIAELAASGPLGYKELTVVKALYPAANQPHLVGLHVVEDGKHLFDLYDLKRQTSLTKVKLADDVDLIDLEPDAKALATTTHDKRFNIYTLPEGGLLADEWSPYDNIQDKIRFLNERGGKVNSIAMISPKDVFVMTSGGFGDLWEMPNQKSSKYILNIAPRESFLKEDVAPGRDFVLSPDRKTFAIATDEGIEIRETMSNKVLGKTPKLETHGKKPNMAGIGFDPAGTKLGVYFSALNGEARTFYHARFGVPGGELISKTAVPDPGPESEVEFVNSEMFLTFDRNDATLRDAAGKTVATCRIPNRSGMFAPKVARGNVAYTFFDDKSRPSLGLTAVPLGGIVAPPPPPPETKGKDLGSLFAKTPTMQETKKPRVFEQQEIWEFGPKGIMRKGFKSFEKQ